MTGVEIFVFRSGDDIEFLFFFQAEDGIRDIGVTGVQTCALPICSNFWPQGYQFEVLHPFAMFCRFAAKDLEYGLSL